MERAIELSPSYVTQWRRVERSRAIGERKTYRPGR